VITVALIDMFKQVFSSTSIHEVHPEAFLHNY